MSNLQKAEALKQTADHIINDLGLGKVLNKYCENVFYTGSYFLDVMAWSDLDISLVLKGDKKSISNLMDLTKDVSLLKGVRKIVYRNFLDNDKDSCLPSGLYNGIYWSVGPLDWKIDLWAVTEESLNKNKSEMQRIRQKLDNDKRQLILQVKNNIITDEGRTPSFSGYNIYKAVIDENMTSQEDIINFLHVKGILE